MCYFSKKILCEHNCDDFKRFATFCFIYVSRFFVLFWRTFFMLNAIMITLKYWFFFYFVSAPCFYMCYPRLMFLGEHIYDNFKILVSFFILFLLRASLCVIPDKCFRMNAIVIVYKRLVFFFFSLFTFLFFFVIYNKKNHKFNFEINKIFIYVKNFFYMNVLKFIFETYLVFIFETYLV